MAKKVREFEVNTAATYKEPSDLTYPLIGSPKIDGVRAVVKDCNLLSRKLIKITNTFTQSRFGVEELNGLDGELVVGDCYDPDCFSNTTGDIRREEGEPDVVFWVFDDFTNPEERYYDRLMALEERVEKLNLPYVKVVEQIIIRDESELREVERHFLDMGYEGMMVRRLDNPYKYGRSTIKEGGIVKIKRFSDTEGVIIGYEQKFSNQNEALKDNMGRTKRSSHKENKIPVDTLGVLLLECKDFKGVVRVGSGFSDELRKEIWNNKEKYMGEIVKFKYFGHGTIDLPRHPVFLGFRASFDM